MTELAVINARLVRKNKKLRQQRDHWKTEYENLRKVLNSFPMYERRYADLEKWKADVAATRALHQRIKEQSLLIQELTKNVQPVSP